MAKAKSEKTTVKRVTAADDKKASKLPKLTKKRPVLNGDDGESKKGFFGSFFGYFKGAWHELKQVRWPSRKATWGMTVALLIFTALFATFILVIDLLWEYLFKLIYS